MSLTQEILNESELAKSYVTNSDLDDNYKKTLLSLIQTTTIATNGISPEEKIQKMTEAIHLLAISQITFVSKVDDRIWHAINKANMKQCDQCRAMRYVTKQEEAEEKEKLFREWNEQQKNGTLEIKQDDDEKSDVITKRGIIDTLKQVILKPYFWFFCCILVISPYGVQIVKLLIENFGSK